MTVLPIVERELRVAARRPSTYRTRAAMGLGAVLIAVSVFLACSGLPAQATARYTFQGLAWLLMLFCLACGRVTANCLDRERREGMLGLLFLTDLKGHDVLLGKLAATSLGGFYGLLAAMPVLALPLLVGGVSSGEVWRMVLTLIDTFLFCLVVGLFSAALCREQRQAAALNLNLLLFLAAVPPTIRFALLYFHPGYGLMAELLFSCPFYPFYLNSDARYGLEPERFWYSLGVIHALTWLLLGLAGWAARHTLRERPERLARTGLRGFWRRLSYGVPSKQAPFRRRLLNINPLYWLAGRARLRPLQVWAFLAVAAGWWLWGWARDGIIWFDKTICLTTAVLLHCTLKVWLIIEAGQRLSEQREAGMLELLLTTPVSVADILRGQWLALRKQFLGPVLAVIAAELFLVCFLRGRFLDSSSLAIWLASILMLPADILALCWVTMLAAFRAKSQHRATIAAMMRILILPWLLWCVAVGSTCFWAWLSAPPGTRLEPSWQNCLRLWVGVGLAADLFFGIGAWRALHRRFRQIALAQFMGPDAVPSVEPSPAADAKVTPKFADAQPAPVQDPRPPSPRLKRRPVLAGLAVVLLLTGLIWLAWASRHRPPPPVLVYLARSNAPPQFLPDWSGVLLILPDGSLWRWGEPGGALLNAKGTGKRPVPERVGTDSDWVQAAVGPVGCIGLRANGTIWQWPGGDLSRIPEQVSTARAVPWPDSARASNGVQGATASEDLEHGWGSVAVAGTNGFAIRTNGTLWRWAVRQEPARARLVQVDGNHDWAAVSSGGGVFMPIFFLRTNGTLWVQAPAAPGFLPFPGQGINSTSPVQVCRETNWLAFGACLGARAWTASGDLWNLSTASPDALAPAARTCQMIASNSAPGRHLLSYYRERLLYEVRPDGTLWHRGFAPMGQTPAATTLDWRRVGKRSDWVSIWGGGLTAFGLTADGTIWTWGTEPGRDPVASLSVRLHVALFRIQTALALGRPPAGPFGGQFPAFIMPHAQKEPRPLMRLLMTSPAQSANELPGASVQ
jgi:hypothetical protein